MRKALLRATLILLAAAAIAFSPAGSARASGPANWQITFSFRGSAPGFGDFGVWGWCDFGGGTTFADGLAVAGTNGNCSYAYYNRNSAASATCHENLDLNEWYLGPNGDWFFAGAATIRPTQQTAFCESLPGNPPTSPFGPIDSLLPAVPGHLDLNGVTLGPFTFNEFQMQSTPTP